MKQPPLFPIKLQVPDLPAPSTLDNGAELHTVPISEAGIVRLTIAFRGGRWVEDKSLQATVALDQIAAGTIDMSAETLSEALDSYGATLTSSAGVQTSLLTFTCLKRTLPQALPLLSDIVKYPAYEEPLVDIEREELIFAARANRQNVTYVSKKLLQKSLLGENHPLARGYDECSVEDLTHDDLMSYHDRFINMGNAVVYASGDVDDDVVALINKHLGKKEDKENKTVELTQYPFCANDQQRHEAWIETESAQSALNLGTILPSRLSPDYPAVALATTILGGYFGSRLMTNIRERLGLTYGIAAELIHLPQSTMMLISTTTPHEHVDRCVDEIFHEMDILQAEPVGEEEMNMAKNFLMGQFCRATELSLSLPAVCIGLNESGHSLEQHMRMMEKIQALTAEELMESARRYMRTSNLIIAAAHGKQAQ